ncbi:class I SAM-dependent methyltransferase [Amycolatopsis panacis]|uniref:hypothetical protein n=1 Tax=Amycolatopsis panacis TaxID=2340917 RepID=UPI001F2DA392|nr:hypothetical protein [Amycolatopsis panacis]
MAERVRAVGGMDPSPDMLEKARRAGVAGGVGNVSWLLGGDTDIPAIARGVGASARSRSARRCTGWTTSGCSPLFGQCCGRAGESPW